MPQLQHVNTYIEPHTKHLLRQKSQSPSHRVNSPETKERALKIQIQLWRKIWRKYSVKVCNVVHTLCIFWSAFYKKTFCKKAGNNFLFEFRHVDFLLICFYQSISMLWAQTCNYKSFVFTKAYLSSNIIAQWYVLTYVPKTASQKYLLAIPLNWKPCAKFNIFVMDWMVNINKADWNGFLPHKIFRITLTAANLQLRIQRLRKRIKKHEFFAAVLRGHFYLPPIKWRTFCFQLCLSGSHSVPGGVVIVHGPCVGSARTGHCPSPSKHVQTCSNWTSLLRERFKVISPILQKVEHSIIQIYLKKLCCPGNVIEHRFLPKKPSV